MVLEHIAADPHIRIGDLPAFDLPEREENETTVKEQDYGTKHRCSLLDQEHRHSLR